MFHANFRFILFYFLYIHIYFLNYNMKYILRRFKYPIRVGIHQEKHDYCVLDHPVIFGSMTNSRDSKCLYFAQRSSLYGFVRPHKGNYGHWQWHEDSLMGVWRFSFGRGIWFFGGGGWMVVWRCYVIRYFVRIFSSCSHSHMSFVCVI